MNMNSGPINESEQTEAATELQPTMPFADGLVGQTVGGRYRVERQLARGGFGAVFLARDTELASRPVVLKVLLEESLRNEWVVNKFKHEIEALARVDHPSIVGVFDAGKLADGKPYIIMQYVEGVNLRSLIKPEGLDFGRAAHIIRQVALALEEAHSKNIFHRDLKPENIMVRSLSNGEEHIKVIDFGIAKIRDSVMAPNTRTELSVGTLGYMSPEQLAAGPVSAANDIYSLGVIAYELIAGRRPFNPTTAVQLADMQRGGVQVMPMDLRPDLSSSAQDVILKALSFDPAERYQNIREFGEKLAQALTSEDAPSGTVNPDAGRESHSAHSPVDAQPSREIQPVKKTGAGSRHDVFISYSTQNKQVAGRVCDALESRGIKCWIAPRDIPPSAAYASAIIHALNESRAVVLIYSSSSNDSEHVMRELEVAVEKRKPIVPFRIEDVPFSSELRYYIGKTQWLTASNPPLKAHLESLASAVRRLLSESGEADDHPDEKIIVPPRPVIRPALVITAAVILLAGALGIWLWLWSKSSRQVEPPAQPPNAAAPNAVPERVFTYYLTPFGQGQCREDAKHFTGNETFRNGSQLCFAFTPTDSGALYLLDAGKGKDGATVFYTLFPTFDLKDNNGTSQLSANQRMLTREITFDQKPGQETLYIIWAAQPVAELEAIFRETSRNGFVVKNPAQAEIIESFLAKYGSPEPQVEIDGKKLQTTVRGRSEIVINKLILEHGAAGL